jgi:hypothetical protein
MIKIHLPKEMNVFNTDEIISNIESQGIKVISIRYADFKSIELKGDLGSFIATAKAFNENVVFFQDFSFDQDDFFLEINESILGEYATPASEDGINLIQFLPALEEYKNYVGQTSSIILRVFYQNKVFAYWHNAIWFEDFIKLFKQAQSIFVQKEKAIREQQAQQQNAAREEAAQREDYLRALLKELSTDDKFISLKTQKAQQEYAQARFPELSELSQHILRDEISNLNARIQARKMLQ